MGEKRPETGDLDDTGGEKQKAYGYGKGIKEQLD